MRIKKKEYKEEAIKRVSVLVPARGSHPEILRSAIQIAKILKVPVRLLIPTKFICDRPSKSGFYTEFMEEQSHETGIFWERIIFEDPLSDFLKKMRQDLDFLVMMKEDELMHTVLSHAPCPILLVPKSFGHGFRQVLLAYAGGRFSEKALHLVALLAKFGKCTVEVLTVGNSSPGLRMAHERARYLMDRWKVNAKFKILKDEVKPCILENCENKEVSLLVLGASETKEWRDHHFRSLSQAIAEEAHCPVMIVK